MGNWAMANWAMANWAIGQLGNLAMGIGEKEDTW